MHRIIVGLLFLAFGAAGAPHASADVIPVPEGLHPGDQYRLVFVTSTTTQASSSDISFYNSLVTTAAQSNPALAALGTTWSAITTTKAINLLPINADANTSTAPGFSSFPIYNLAGQIVAASNSALWSGTIQAPIDVNELGNLTTAQVWTGSLANGEANAAIIGNVTVYTSYLGFTPAFYGLDTATNSDWVSHNTLAKTNSLALYGMSGVLTVPEPGTLALACLATIGLSLPVFRRWRRQG